MVVKHESAIAKELANQYRRYFEKPFLINDELKEAERIRQRYIKETNYKIND